MNKKQLIVAWAILLTFVTTYLIFAQDATTQFSPKYEKEANKRLGLGEQCNPELNNCENDLECVYCVGLYRCIRYLKESEECGINVAGLCGRGLSCTDTGETRTVCGVFTTDGLKECFVEPMQVCKPLQKERDNQKESPTPKLKE